MFCTLFILSDVFSTYGSIYVSEFLCELSCLPHSGVPRNFFRGGSTNSVEDRGQRERGSGVGNPLVRGSGGSCNLVQEI